MPEPKMSASTIIVAFVVPTVIGKSMILFFGGKYSNEPGNGWGYLLTLAILFTVTTAGLFIWRFRNHKDK